MIKNIEDLRKIEAAANATPPDALLNTKNSNGETIADEIDRLIGSYEKYTIEDLSEEARILLKIQ